MTNDPVLHLLGLAKKAGRLEIGEEPVGAVCRSRQARVVLLAADAAPNTRRRAAHFGEAGNVLWIETPFDKAALGFVLGRSSCAMLALTDAGFAAAVGEKLAVRDPDKYGPGSCGPRLTGCFSARRSSGSMRRSCARAGRSRGPRRPPKRRGLRRSGAGPERLRRPGLPRPAAVPGRKLRRPSGTRL